jgi:RecA/RadA recombinase
MPSAAEVRAILAAMPHTSALRLASSLAPAGTAVATGLAEVEALLGGGLPRGRVAELVGPASAGRTGLALAVATAATQRGEVVAWVDLEDALDPPSLAAAGADLARVLWVRPTTVLEGLQAADAVLAAGGFGLVVVDFGDGPAGPAPTGRESPFGDFDASSARTSGVRGRRSTGSAAAWTRLAHRAERAGTTVLVSATREVAGAHATVALALTRQDAVMAGRPALLERIDTRVSLTRCRFAPPGTETVLPLAATI